MFITLVTHYDAAFQVGASVVRIEKAAFGMIRERIEREIPSSEVEFDRIDEGHARGMARVFVRTVDAICRDLDDAPARIDRHRSIIFSEVSFSLKNSRNNGGVSISKTCFIHIHFIAKGLLLQAEEL